MHGDESICEVGNDNRVFFFTGLGSKRSRSPPVVHEFEFDYVSSTEDHYRLFYEFASDAIGVSWKQQRNATFVCTGAHGSNRVLFRNDGKGVLRNLTEKLFDFCAAEKEDLIESVYKLDLDRATELHISTRLPKLDFALMNVWEEGVDDMFSSTFRCPNIQPEVDFRSGKNTRVEMPGLSRVQFDSACDLVNAVHDALLRPRRNIGHWILQIRITRWVNFGNEKRVTKLNIVQMACTDTLSNRLICEPHICAAASSLCHCIRSVCTRDKAWQTKHAKEFHELQRTRHVPSQIALTRSHVLTRILSDCLNCESRCFVLGSVAPTQTHSSSTRHTLRLINALQPHAALATHSEDASNLRLRKQMKDRILQKPSPRQNTIRLAKTYKTTVY